MAPPAGISDQDACVVLIEGVRRLAGHQVITSEKVCQVFFRFGAEELSNEGADILRWLLKKLGYEPRWVHPLGRPNTFCYVWARGPWPIDFGANLNRDFDAFVPMR